MKKFLFSWLLLAAILLASCRQTSAGSASIGDLTWLDANANGLQDGGEEGLAGVAVRLYDTNGNMLAATRSDADGRYAFSDLRPGDYALEFVAPAGYGLTKADQGEDDARDSDPNPATGKTTVISLAAGQTAENWDAGFRPEVAALPTKTPTPEPTLTPTPAGPPVEPEEVVIHGKDGDLQGRYYRAATEPAPLVVLMHWVNGDMSDWNEIAVWLQNRGQKNPYPNPGNAPWWDPSWFPPVPQGRSYAVLTFTYTGCQPSPVGCPDWTPETWLFDSMTVMIEAAKLPRVDPNRIVAIGSSIGADGAVIGCAETGCAGALSLSPGNFLADPQASQTSYSGAVKWLLENNPQAHVWCLADENEISVCKKAESVGGANYRAIEIPGGKHGTVLLSPNLNPLPMQLILDFLEQVFGQ